MAASPARGASVVHTPVTPQSVRDLITRGYFLTANGHRMPVSTTIGQSGVSRPHVVRSRGVTTNAGPLGVGTANATNVRANQDFGAFVPHSTVSIAQDPVNQTHLTLGAEDTRLGVGGQGTGTTFQLAPNAYSGFYDTKDAGKTYTDGLVQNIANDPGGLYPSMLGFNADSGGFNDPIHGRYSFSDDPRLAFDKYGDLYYSSMAVVDNAYDTRNGLTDVLVTRSSAYQNTGNPAGGGPCAFTGGPLNCSYDNPTTPLAAVSVTGGAAGRFFDGTQLPPVPNTINPLPAGIPNVVDTNDAGGLTGTDFNTPPWADDYPTIAVDNRPNGSQAIYEVFTRFDLAKGTADLYYSYSTDGGNTFSPPMNIDPVSNAYCMSVNPANPATGTCDANLGAYVVVDNAGNPSIVFENFNARSVISLPNDGNGNPSPYSDPVGSGTINHALLMVTCTQFCAGGGTPNWGANESNGATFISSVVDVAGQFNYHGEDPDHGATFRAWSYPSASVNPRDNSISVVWSDARATERSTGLGDPGVRLSTSAQFLGEAGGGARVWEATVSPGIGGSYGPTYAPSEVWPLTVRSADNDEVDQLFPTISQSLSPAPSVGVNTYVAFYTRYNVNTQPDPYGFGVLNSNMNYTLTRNTYGNQPTIGEQPEIVNVNNAPMPLPLVNNGQILTKYTQMVADTGGAHLAWVDTRANAKNFFFNGAEDIFTAYIH